MTVGPPLTLLLEVAVEADEAGEEEDGVVRLLLDFGAPVPRRREASIDAASRVKEVIRSAAIERYTHARSVLTHDTHDT